MADARIARVLMRDPDAATFRTTAPAAQRPFRAYASRRRPGTDASSIATVPTPRPRRPARAPNMRPPSINHLAMERFVPSSSGPGRPARQRRSASRARARAFYWSTRRGSRATSPAAGPLRRPCGPPAALLRGAGRRGGGRRLRARARLSQALRATHRGAARRHDPTTTPRRLVEQAQEAGAEFRDGATADGIDATNCDRRRQRRRFVRGVGGTRPRGRARGERPLRSRLARPLRTARVVEFGIVPSGYGWVFPKGDHVNVGVEGWLHQGPHLRAPRAALPAPSGSRRMRSPTSVATSSRCDGGIHARAGPNRARRRCGRPRRSGLRRRHLRPCSARSGRAHWRSSPAAPTISAHMQGH